MRIFKFFKKNTNLEKKLMVEMLNYFQSGQCSFAERQAYYNQKYYHENEKKKKEEEIKFTYLFLQAKIDAGQYLTDERLYEYEYCKFKVTGHIDRLPVLQKEETPTTNNNQ